ncbi:aldehyde dehydrogenase family protein [Nitrospirillum bahiense]|uniref:Aldehyde dehydrogenase (NAD+) n=1 Tax=Nitrospirillum amazonense TaxID=28077 RepID=A0A560FVZ0_9PROT|nr:aldehyde dehydrogenase family protein [Nitrospirillum amazonense]TWB25650.1 aldehyde dehydrogenase (NAD+) [Nitrospirillum amazonense]
MEKLNWIGGRQVAGIRLTPNSNPANPDDVIGHYACASPDQAAEAIAAARAAAPAWAATNPQTRSDILRRTGDLLHAHAEELGALLTREEGKTLREGIGEVRRSAQIFHYAAGEPLRAGGESLPGLRDGMTVVVSREPVGVVGLITPWNFPMALPAWKTAYAMAYGNTVVLKPSDVTPACAWELASLLHQAGLPAGVFNLVMGPGSRLGPALVDGADAISFTGSPGVGQDILARSVPRRIKVQLELGGKNPLVVLDDADLDLAADIAVQGAFHSTGQRCTATSRIIVHRHVHDAFVERLVARTRGLRVGDPMAPETDMGPVVNEGQLQKNLGYVAEARTEGAELACGGKRLDRPGWFMEPALFVGTNNAMRINRDEVFGPVACIISADDLDHAIAIANDSEHALSSGVVTRSLSAAEAFRRRSHAGLVMVNAPTAGIDYHVPFGGRGASGYGGREQGSAAIEFFTEGKTAYVNHGVIG